MAIFDPAQRDFDSFYQTHESAHRVLALVPVPVPVPVPGSGAMIECPCQRYSHYQVSCPAADVRAHSTRAYLDRLAAS